MFRIRFLPPDPEKDHAFLRECACCGGRYAVKRRGMMLFEEDGLEGEICPECVLIGPRGAAAKVRERLAAIGAGGGTPDERKEGAAWGRLLIRRARLLDATPSFSLAARQAAVRETRERR